MKNQKCFPRPFPKLGRGHIPLRNPLPSRHLRWLDFSPPSAAQSPPPLRKSHKSATGRSEMFNLQWSRDLLEYSRLQTAKPFECPVLSYADKQAIQIGPITIIYSRTHSHIRSRSTTRRNSTPEAWILNFERTSLSVQAKPMLRWAAYANHKSLAPFHFIPCGITWRGSVLYSI